MACSMDERNGHCRDATRCRYPSHRTNQQALALILRILLARKFSHWTLQRMLGQRMLDSKSFASRLVLDSLALDLSLRSLFHCTADVLFAGSRRWRS
jgi:hypothetical protein